MIVRPIKTRLVTAKSCSLLDLIDEYITELPEKSVVAMAAKIVATCEGRVVPLGSVDKDELVAKESQQYMPSSLNRYGVTLAIARNRLVAAAGVDESNGNGHYVLWPVDPQKTVNEVRAHLSKKFGVKDLGVIITDSTTRPLQWGTTGVSIAYSGFEPLRSYVGEEDLFGRPFDYHKNSIQNGLAAAAVLVGGECTEQTPIVVLSELDFVEFVDRNPTEEELADQNIELEDDLYGLMLKDMPWQKGKQQ
jgi:dihydrofolate synthase / folylpolyglutamate synthase